jgi:hypothetical protein
LDCVGVEAFGRDLQRAGESLGKMARENSKRGVFVHPVGKAGEQTRRIHPTTASGRLRARRNGRSALGLADGSPSLEEFNYRDLYIKRSIWL